MRDVKKEKKFLYRDKEWLYDQIVMKGKTQEEVSKDANCSRSTIRNWSRKYNIELPDIRGNEQYKSKEKMYNLLIEKDLTYSEVAELFGYPCETIRYWAIRFNIERDNTPEWVKLNDKYGTKIVEEYLEEDTYIQDLMEKYDVGRETIWRVLNHNNISFKTRSQIKRIGDKKGIYRVHNLNQDYFKTWSHNMAYILGLIVADGCIYTNTQEKNGKKKHKNVLHIELSKKDEEILEKIKNELQYDGKIHTYKSNGFSKEKI